GSNVVSGDATSWFYPDSLVSKPVKVNCNCPLGQTGYTLARRLDYSATFGGPIRKDRVFFFGAWIYTNRREYNPGVNPTLPFAAWNNGSVGKVTWQTTNRLRIQSMFQAKPWYLPGTPSVSRPYETTQVTGGNNLMYSEEVTATLAKDALLTIRANGWVGKGPAGPNYTPPPHGDKRTPDPLPQAPNNACLAFPDVGRTP